ncbi:hypothetical protein QCD60_05195 [Pokkaliibacter sp. MBI-7]|uniref:hypothetical protein n=1 Tax=Pokkaliibacter sp. MBI-7 TaxID=3040600 RepID=UPI002449F0E6|nr:hypothetical protein [Pokkaliibacter sp. MBI-7]MDH2431949.1 hypothetical protein [Pokkaliibacter sp. MBI-7]
MKQEPQAPTEQDQKKTRLNLKITLSIPMVALMLAAASLLISVNLWLWVPTPSVRSLSARVDAMTTQWQQDTQRIETDYRDWKTLLSQQQQQAEQMASMLDTLEQGVAASSSAQMLALMIEQEGNYQEFLTNLKTGMQEMSDMVRGSRTWFDEYNRRMNVANEASKARLERLQNLLKQIKSSPTAPHPGSTMPSPAPPATTTAPGTPAMP